MIILDPGAPQSEWYHDLIHTCPKCGCKWKLEVRDSPGVWWATKTTRGFTLRCPNFKCWTEIKVRQPNPDEEVTS